MKIILAGKKTEHLRSIRLLLEAEIEGSLSIKEAIGKKQLFRYMGKHRPHVLILLNGFSRDHGSIIDFSTRYPLMNIIIIDRQKVIRDKQEAVSELVFDDRPEVLETFIDLVKENQKRCRDLEKIFIK